MLSPDNYCVLSNICGGGDDRGPGGAVQTAQLLIGDRCPWRCMPSSGSMTQPSLLLYILPHPETPPPFAAKLDFPLMVPRGRLVDFRVCWSVHVNVPCLCECPFHEWLWVVGSCTSQRGARLKGRRRMGVVLFRVALAVCGVVKSLTPTHPPAHSRGMQCVFLMNQLSLCAVWIHNEHAAR